jgi:hypothetical protein
LGFVKAEIQEVKGELEDFSTRGATMWAAENGPPVIDEVIE